MAKIETVVGAVIGLISMFGALFLVGWFLTAGIFALVCLCFGWAFSWLTAMGIWIIVLAATLWLSFTVWLGAKA